MKLRDLIHTIYFNFKVFSFKEALKLPVYISKDIKLIEAEKGSIKINAPLSRGMINFGIQRGSLIPGITDSGFFKVSKNARVVFNGKAVFNRATSLVCINDAVLTFGNNFKSNAASQYFADKEITFGDDVLIGWRVSFHDGDGHKVLENGEATNAPRSIYVGNHVWIGAESVILKGTYIPDGCVVARNSLVTKDFREAGGCVIGGNTAKILKRNVTWEE